MKILKNLVAIFFFKENNIHTEYNNSRISNYQGGLPINLVATNIKNNNILNL